MLRSSIHKPAVLYSDDPILTYGFLNLINIFEKLKPDLYDWVSVGCNDEFSKAPPTGSIQSELCRPISLAGVIEIQKVDILVTQQWLQAMMWKLSMSCPSKQANRGDAVLPFHLPVLVGKTVLDVIGSVSQGAMDAHGIGMVGIRSCYSESYANAYRSKNFSIWVHLSQTLPIFYDLQPRNVWPRLLLTRETCYGVF